MQPTSGPPGLTERYRLIRSLGEGGMGRVWLARDEVLRREVAVKEVIPPSGLTEAESDQASARGLREARAIARLSHPNVVRIYDVLAGRPHPWIVMEYVPARSLQQVLEQDGPRSPAEAARIGLGVLAALGAAHRAGVLHRDVKPSNVLLSDDRVVLTDFGLATLAGDSTLTRSGQILGSPAYIAPERARDGTTGPESDLWSLGATLYAAVEGRSPYQRSTAIATLTALATEPPDRAPHAGPLGRIIKGLLEKDPRARMDAAEAEQRLRRVAGPASRTARSSGSGGSSGIGWPRPRRSPDAAPADAPTPPTTSLPVVAAVAAPSLPPEVPPIAPAGPVGPVGPAGPVGPVGPETATPAYRRFAVVALSALVVVVISAVVVGVVLRPDRTNTSGAPRAGAASTPGIPSPSVSVVSSAPASAPASPSAAPPSPGTGPSAGALPAGWHWYHDPTNFTVAVPDGWGMSRRNGIVYFSDPAGGRLLGIDQTDQPQMDPVADWTRQSQRRVANGDFPGYQQIKIALVDYHIKAADWEFTYNNGGVRTHVINRGAVFGPHQAYGFYWSTPEAAWTANLPTFDLITSTFQGQQD